ncbi:MULTISPECIES: FAD-binding protein [Burkholderiaceae]|uniref:electron transfer flavoprotein subunit alpha/FixB family protein n=1 Tax=Burkholderiaceae TaxID=119060 RepID=UPI00142086BB|nr:MULTISPECIES: FAD-binding protein [Burkholderiaceae]NIF54206.1 electron transfer flavoprotein subunit alpha/FixB family protein [Burkholderia sp. Ax-1724]NIF77684.1 electron transfer flavoprotein subunit alpha/FixB family protein [Paraburkholderia sp. Cy-641]
MAVLVIADHDGEKMSESVRNVVTCARELSNEVDVIVAGETVGALAESARRIAGVRVVKTLEATCYRGSAAENVGHALAAMIDGYTHVLAAASGYGKNLVPRLAALADVQPVSDVMQVLSADTFKRPTYAGNVIATVRSSDRIKLMTVRVTAFAAAPLDGDAPVEACGATADLQLSRVVSIDIAHSDRPDLSSARVVVSGGRGMGSAKNFEVLTPLADKLGAAIGASRAAVDLGFVPNDYQVGQTGKVVAPEVYVAVGISGAIQHLAGMRDSKYIFAINRDPEAPICAVADYWLNEDLFEAVPALVDAL